MAKKPYGPKYEKEQKKQRALEQKVLEHLKKHGSSLYVGLYILFDQDRTAAIGPALQDLKEYGYIEIAKDEMVTITASGLKRLEEKAY